MKIKLYEKVLMTAILIPIIIVSVIYGVITIICRNAIKFYNKIGKN